MSISYRKFAVLSAVLSVLGIVVAVELTRIHLFVHTDPDYRSVCAVSEGVNCETVALSPYSVFAGIPVSVWGIIGYSAMALLSFWSLSRRRLHGLWPWGLLFVAAFAAMVASLILAVISATKIDSLCLFCMSTYAINAILLAIAIVVFRRSRARISTLVLLDLTALAIRPKLGALLLIGTMTAVGTTVATMPRYWEPSDGTALPLPASGTDADGSHWVGAENPELTIVEYSDYECPHCRVAHEKVRLLVASHPNRLRLVHRHLPLDQKCHPKVKRPFHKHACELAAAAECAAFQQKFWEMNDALFSMQISKKKEIPDLLEMAVSLGLDRSEFKQCLSEDEAGAKVAADIEASVRRGLSGTPSYIVGDKTIVGRVPVSEIEAALAAAATNGSEQ